MLLMNKIMVVLMNKYYDNPLVTKKWYVSINDLRIDRHLDNIFVHLASMLVNDSHSIFDESNSTSLLNKPIKLNPVEEDELRIKKHAQLDQIVDLINQLQPQSCNNNQIVSLTADIMNRSAAITSFPNGFFIESKIITKIGLLLNELRDHDNSFNLFVTISNFVSKSEEAALDLINQDPKSLLYIYNECPYAETRNMMFRLISFICIYPKTIRYICKSEIIKMVLTAFNQCINALLKSKDYEKSFDELEVFFTIVKSYIIKGSRRYTLQYFVEISKIFQIFLENLQDSPFIPYILELIMNLASRKFCRRIVFHNKQPELVNKGLYKTCINLIHEPPMETSVLLPIIKLISIISTSSDDISSILMEEEYFPYSHIIHLFVETGEDEALLNAFLTLFINVSWIQCQYVKPICEKLVIEKITNIAINANFELRKAAIWVLWTIICNGDRHDKIFILDSPCLQILLDSFSIDETNFLKNIILNSIDSLIRFMKVAVNLEPIFDDAIEQMMPLVNELTAHENDDISEAAYYFIAKHYGNSKFK